MGNRSAPIRSQVMALQKSQVKEKVLPAPRILPILTKAVIAKVTGDKAILVIPGQQVRFLAEKIDGTWKIVGMKQ